MSHQVQLSPAESHRPTAVLDPARHATDPRACRADARTPPGNRPVVPGWGPAALAVHGRLLPGAGAPRRVPHLYCSVLDRRTLVPGRGD